MFMRPISVASILVSALIVGAFVRAPLPGQAVNPRPASAHLVTTPAGLNGTAEYLASGSYTWVAPAGVRGVVLELWGAGGGGSRPYGYQSSGDGGGSGAYVRSVVAVQPGASYLLTVGAGGFGGAYPAPFGTPGEVGGATTFADAAGQVLVWAGGGYGGNDANDGHGGPVDPSAQIGRVGRDGGHGFGVTPGSGGKAWIGSLEPVTALVGGHGGVGQVNASGADGSPGYAILLW
ncbi:MAG: hypothetical protein IT453_05035 [Planctomycetes bacterium]|nr:hypothetical protein [Planctomycetota bacterium]